MVIASFALLAGHCVALGPADTTTVKPRWGFEAGITWLMFPDQKSLCDPSLPPFMAAFYNDKPTEQRVGNRQAIMVGGVRQGTKGTQLGLSVGWQSYRGLCDEWRTVVAPFLPSIGSNSICFRADHLWTTRGERRPGRLRASIQYGAHLSGRAMTADYKHTMPFYGGDVKFTTTAEASAFHIGLGPAIALGLRSERSSVGVSTHMNLLAYTSGSWSRTDDRFSMTTGPELIEQQGTFSEFLFPDRLSEFGILFNDISMTYRYVFGARPNR